MLYTIYVHLKFTLKIDYYHVQAESINQGIQFHFFKQSHMHQCILHTTKTQWDKIWQKVQKIREITFF